VKNNNTSSERIRLIALSKIEEDPHQPRTESNPGFSLESLRELATTISQRGVKSPISVRKHPEHKEHYIINHGARRFRASKLAGKKQIPAFIDNDYNEVDQVIENLQRNELTSREIAEFIHREIKVGKKKKDIAVQIGKSAAFVKQHATLLNLPEPIAEAFHRGRVRDVTVINDLATAYKKDPDGVTVWLEDETQEISRNTVRLMRNFWERNDHAEETTVWEESLPYPVEDADKKTSTALRKAIVQIEHKTRPGILLLHRRPTKQSRVWIRYDKDDSEAEVEVASVKLIGLKEA
jgi:ParB family transcriptional regulator, chromosome partitioning protein